MSETLRGTAAELAGELETRYRRLQGASARRSNRSLLYLTALSLGLLGSLIAFGYGSELTQQFRLGLLLAGAGLGLAGWTRLHFSGEPLDPPPRLPELALLFRATEQLSDLPVMLEVDLKHPDKLRGTYREAPWKASLEWEFLDTLTHDRSESYQPLTPQEQREQLSGELSPSDLRDRPWQERNVRVTVHTKRLLLRVELDGQQEAGDGTPSQHLKFLKLGQSETGTTFLWEFPKNHSEKEGLGHDGRPDAGVSRINHHHPEFVGEQVGCAVAWLLEKSRPS